MARPARIVIEACPEMHGRPCYIVRHNRTAYIVGAFDTPAAHVHRAQAETLAQELDQPRPRPRRRPRV